MQKGFVGILVLIVLAAAAAAGAYYLGTQKSGGSSPITQSPSPSAFPASSPDKPAGWNTYTNTLYGFQISYPDDYEVMEDVKQIFPNAVVGISNPGQAYDVIIQVWDSESDYNSYQPNTQYRLPLTKSKDKYITVMNNSGDSENEALIKTFRIIK